MVAQFKHGYALIIGVGDAQLTAPERDAQALAALLRNSQRAGYPDEQVKELTREKATRQAILGALDWLALKARLDPHATVLIYFSGHGVRILNQAGAVLGYSLVPYGFNPSLYTDTGLTGAEFTQRLQAIQAQKLVVLLDCCHAAGLPETKGEEQMVSVPLPPDLDRLEMGSGQVVVASSRADQKSYGGAPNSIFTAALLDALSGKGTRLPTGYAGILDVLAYLLAAVPQRAAPYAQNPIIKKIADLSENFPLCYYAGGETTLPGLLEPEEAKDLASAELTAEKQQRLEVQLATLRQEHAHHLETWKGLRLSLPLLKEPALFYVEQQVLEEEAAMSGLESRIQRIDAALKAAAPQLALPGELAGRLDPQTLLEYQVHNALLKLNFTSQGDCFNLFLNKHINAAAFLIQGKPYFGQRWLLNRLLLSAGASDSHPIVLNLGGLATYSGLGAIWLDLQRRLGIPHIPPLPPDQVVPRITSRLLEKLQTQHLTLIFYNIHLLGEALTTQFLLQLWPPLASGAARLPRTEKDRRLLLFLVDNVNETSNWQLPLVQTIDDAWRPDSPVHLEEISPFTPALLDYWFNNVKTELPTTFASQYAPTSSQEIYDVTAGGIPEDVLIELCQRCQVDWFSKENTWIPY